MQRWHMRQGSNPWQGCSLIIMKIQAVHIEQTQNGLSKTVTIALLRNTLFFDLRTGFSSKGAMPTQAWACVTPSRHAYTSVSMAPTGVSFVYWLHSSWGLALTAAFWLKAATKGDGIRTVVIARDSAAIFILSFAIDWLHPFPFWSLPGNSVLFSV